MGQKVNPIGLRVGFIKNWESLWFTKKQKFAELLHEDIHIRDYIKSKFSSGAISKVEVERTSRRMHIKVHTARPGIIIGRHGADIDRLRDEIQEMTGKEVYIDIKEIKNPATEAQLIAENVAFQLEKRVAFRRAMKRAVEQSLKANVLGIKISCAGRLGGAELSRRETYKRGKIPLQTFRANIDYGFAQGFTTYGTIGVKVWVCK